MKTNAGNMKMKIKNVYIEYPFHGKSIQRLNLCTVEERGARGSCESTPGTSRRQCFAIKNWDSCNNPFDLLMTFDMQFIAATSLLLLFIYFFFLNSRWMFTHSLIPVASE